MGMLNPLRDKNGGVLIPGVGGGKTPVTTACPERGLESKSDGFKIKHFFYRLIL